MYRSTKIGLDTLLDTEKFKHIVRKTNIICTLGPACSSEPMLGKLLDAGMNVARFDFSNGTHESHLAVLKQFRSVLAAQHSNAACLLDTTGPSIYTSMLRGGKNIQLEEGQEIIVEAVGDRYTEFEGFKDSTGTRIGLSYAKLCSSVAKASRILLADGTISIEVEEILSDTELKGRVLNSQELGKHMNCNLPGVHVQLPVLNESDICVLQKFGCKHGVDFVAASFVQCKEDVLFVRTTLDASGGHHIKIISKIENQAGLRNYDKILEVTDGVMVVRGKLGLEIPVQKVRLLE
jgi:pyruvate kinase